jgi:hypothetical protein
MIETETRIFSIEKEQVAKLNDLFWKTENSKTAQSIAFSGAALAAAGAIFSAGQASAGTATGATDAAAAAAASIASGVTNAINMIKAIDGIGLAAFGVALAPMGFMVTLRVLNMVLSRVENLEFKHLQRAIVVFSDRLLFSRKFLCRLLRFMVYLAVEKAY